MIWQASLIIQSLCWRSKSLHKCFTMLNHCPYDEWRLSCIRSHDGGSFNWSLHPHCWHLPSLMKTFPDIAFSQADRTLISPSSSSVSPSTRRKCVCLQQPSLVHACVSLLTSWTYQPPTRANTQQFVMASYVLRESNLCHGVSCLCFRRAADFVTVLLGNCRLTMGLVWWCTVQDRPASDLYKMIREHLQDRKSVV